jgi:hypothetical protein
VIVTDGILHCNGTAHLITSLLWQFFLSFGNALDCRVCLQYIISPPPFYYLLSCLGS